MQEEQTQQPSLETVEFKHKLFGGTIGYDSQADYLKFLTEIDKAKALYVLVAAVNYAHSKGAYSMQESGLLDVSIKAFIRPEDTQETNNPQTTE